MFDLDGTLTRRDTLLPYLVAALRARPARIARLWIAPWALGAFAASGDRGALKSRLIRAVLGGLTRAELARLTAGFLDRQWPRLLRATAREALERHREAGDYLVILSASTDLYVREIGARLGVDEVICTEVRFDGERLDGRLASANRRDAEKTRCIRALEARLGTTAVTAYGNSGSDLDHLRAVEHGVFVNGSPAARRKARAAGLPCLDWP